MLITVSSVWPTITAIANKAGKPGLAAISYFGQNGDQLLPLKPGSSLVVDASITTVANGITSPHSLLRMAENGVKIYTVSDLHAKIVCFENVAFIGSANASLNSKNYLIEAVLKTSTIDEIVEVKEFIKSIAKNQLDIEHIKALIKFYTPPKKNWIIPEYRVPESIVARNYP